MFKFATLHHPLQLLQLLLHKAAAAAVLSVDLCLLFSNLVKINIDQDF